MPSPFHFDLCVLGGDAPHLSFSYSERSTIGRAPRAVLESLMESTLLSFRVPCFPPTRFFSTRARHS
eukprot:4936534-Pleurochrysis_carterae.AAC.1